MNPIPVTAIVDIGKSNKKILLFDAAYELVYEHVVQLSETTDEDGFPCEDIFALNEFVAEGLKSVLMNPRFQVNAINCSAYGATLVHLDQQGKPVAPIYNYLKPYPQDLQESFYANFGGQEELSRSTASPALGNLNSGLQLYRIKYERPDLFSRICFSLHLPQYIAYLIGGAMHTELTSVGCHTHLWNFDHHHYHDWVKKEDLLRLFPPLEHAVHTSRIACYGKSVHCGIGLHDSSSALIPHLLNESEPFVLLSTGTWCIALNPFNHIALTQQQLKNDCLCYLQYSGKPIMASRFFGGYEHEQGIYAISKKYSISSEQAKQHSDYLLLIEEIVNKQVQAIELIQNEVPLQTIIVDGGFSSNRMFMDLLAQSFPGKHIKSSTIHQGTALGAAMVMGLKNV